MNRNYLVFALLIAFFVASCSSATNVQSTGTVATTPLSSETATERPVRPTQTPTATATPLPAIIFPDWVKDPLIDILLLPLSTDALDYMGLALINPVTGEEFLLPLSDARIGGYFWMPNGQDIGLLSLDQKFMLIVDTLNGNVDRYPLSSKQTQFTYSHTPPAPHYVTTGDISSDEFLIVADFWEISPNGKYILAEQNYDDRRSTTIYDVANDESIIVPFPGGEYRDVVFRAWAPSEDHSLLALVGATEEMGAWYYFDTRPDFLLAVYDVKKQMFIEDYKNINLPYWSPDETSFLYQPVKLNDDGSASSWRTPPCIYDTTTDETNCFHGVLSNYTGVLGYEEISALSWVPNENAIAYTYYQYIEGEFPFVGDGGLCLIEISTEEIDCLLQDLGTDVGGNRVPHTYSWSPGGEFVSFGWGFYGPFSDDEWQAGAGIATIQTGEYSLVTYGVRELDLGLWRPQTNK